MTNNEIDKVSRLQAALADAVVEISEWLEWAVANDRATKSQIADTEKKIKRWKAISEAVLPSEWNRAVAEHGAPLRRP